MRITNSILQSNASRYLQQNLQGMAQAQTQASTGKRYERFSQDPHAQSNVMQASSSLRALEQYRRNINDANQRASAEDSVLDQLTNLIDRAKSLAVQEGTATASASTHASAKVEVDNLLDFAVSLGNTKHGSDYLFGGDSVTTAPLTNTPPFFNTAAPTGSHTTEISAGQLFKSTHNANEIFLGSGTLQALKDLSTALGTNNQTAIGNALQTLTTAQNNVQVLVGDLGARVNQLDVTSSNLDALEGTLTNFKSNLSEIDQEAAITDLLSRQTAYQSAMLATSRVIGMTLTDYLR
jgi:flagellar hook-associated protein 3 FlgL